MSEIGFIQLRNQIKEQARAAGLNFSSREAHAIASALFKRAAERDLSSEGPSTEDGARKAYFATVDKQSRKDLSVAYSASDARLSNYEVAHRDDTAVEAVANVLEALFKKHFQTKEQAA